MQNNLKKAALIAVSVVTAVGGMSGCSQNLNGTQVVSTVNDEDIDVGLLNLMVRYQQAETDYFYSMYFGSSVDMWDDVADEETGETYGEQEVAEILQSLELLVIMRQHADEYDVSISDEEAAKIAEAAQGFIESNDPDTIKKMGVDQAMAEEYLSLYYLQEQMYDPMVADVDTEVSDEEAQQTGITYIEVEAVSETDSDSDSDWSSDSDSDWESDSDSDWVSDSDSDWESDSDSDWSSDSDSDWESDSDSDWASDSDSDSSEEVDPAAMEEAQDKAQEILDQVLADPDGDMEEIAQSVDEDLYASTASFTTNPEEDAEDDSGVPEDVQTAAKSLKDGEIYKELVEAGDAFYIVRLDAMFDEEATEDEKENIVNERQQDAYNDLTAQWEEESSIEENKSVLKKVKLKDNDKYTLVVDTDSDSDLILDSDSDSDSDIIYDSDSDSDADSDSDSDADSQETTDTGNSSQE